MKNNLNSINVVNKTCTSLLKPHGKSLDFLLSLTEDEEMMREQGGILSDKEREAFKAFILEHWRIHGFGHYIICHRNTPIGAVSLKAISEKDPFDVGFSVLRSHRGRGYATNSVRSLIKEASSKAYVFEYSSYVKPTNTNAKKILLRNGFKMIQIRDLVYANRTIPNMEYWTYRTQQEELTKKISNTPNFIT